jgi:hypothetical protein
MCITAAPIIGEASRWSSSSRVIVDASPSQPISCCQKSRVIIGVSVRESRHEEGGSDSRWSSGDRVAIDTAPSQPSSHVSAIKESLLRHNSEMKNVKPSTVKRMSINARHPSSWSKSKLVVNISPFRCSGEQISPRRTHALSA